MDKAEPLKLRLRKLHAKIRSSGLDGVIMVPGPNLRYYSGNRSQLFERPFLFFVPDEGMPHLLAPNFEAGPYRRTSLELEVIDWDDSTGPSRAFQKLARKMELKGRWGCEGRVPFGYVNRLLNKDRLNLVDGEVVLQSIRVVKSDQEIVYLERAASILVKSFLSVIGVLRAGIREQELARKLTDDILSNGAESCDFCNVQSGARAADPHSEASSRKLGKGESLVIDAGCTYMGYHADLTRTFVVGKSEEFEKVYDSVLEAQGRGVIAVRPGAKTGSVDAATRQSLVKKGFGNYFTHRTGHGLGLEVHEAPFLVSGGEERLRKGMVLTIEPGVYIPKTLGVRIEDDVVVTANGRDLISRKLPKEYGWWR
ncbi:MAG: Xaa-Pro peptidase family protein [Thaumarchaeota archaeon]|nr:aminopeptidase P family protein [Nitrososphaerota archaeon]MCS4540594.1 Xaa-Pro peptidase family protein [Nitrososphaerota archaeon]